MKTEAVRYMQEGGLEIFEMEVSDPGPGKVQIRGTACGICAFDRYAFKHGVPASRRGPDGHEGVGYVSKVGPGVTGVREGDRVVGIGFTRRYNVDAADLHLIPDDGRPDEHWIVEPVSCVVTGLDHSRVLAGDRLVLVGCGFMGLLLLQGLSRSLAEQVIAIDLRPDRLELARAFGATQVLDARAESFEQQLADLRAREIHTVVDCTGTQQGLDTSTKLLRPGGRLILFGWNHGRASFDGDAWHLGGLTVINAAPNSHIRKVFEPAIRLMAAGIINLEPLVTHVVPLEEAADLLRRVTEGQEPDYIKGVVRL